MNSINRLNEIACLLAGQVLCLAGGCVHSGPSITHLRQDLAAQTAAAAYREPAPVPGKLTLGEAKALALRDNPGLEALRARIESAEMRRRRAYATYFPQLDFSASASHTEESPGTSVFGGTTFTSQNEPFESYRTGLSLSWLLFDGLAREYNVLAARYGRQATEAARVDAQRVLAQSVAQLFFNALLAQKRAQIAQADQDFNQAFLEETRKRQEQGSATRSEVLNFQIRVDNARIASINARNDYAVACIVLAELMGYPGKELAPETTLVEPPLDIQPAGQLQEALATAIAARPDLARVMHELQAAEAAARARVGAFFPQWLVGLDWGYSDVKPYFSRFDQSLSWNTSLQWNLFSGGRDYYARREAQADARATRQELISRWQSVISETRQQIQSLETAAAKVAIQEEIIAATELIRQDVEKAYKAGQETLTRLNEAQRDLIVARENLAVDQIQYLLATENLAAAVGDNTRDLPALGQE